MRVLMVTPAYYPAKGGTETMVRSLSIELNKMGTTTDVMTFNMNRKWNPKWRANTERIDGITVFRIPALNWMPVAHSARATLGVNLFPGRFTHILKRYDVVHFHEFDLTFPLFSSLIRKPKLIHFHGIDPDFFVRYHLSRMILKNVADLYISISKQIENVLVTIGIPRKKIVNLPNGVNTNLFKPKGEKEDNLLLFVGRIEVGKGLDVLLDSLHYLENSVRLVIIGPPDWNLNYHRKFLKSIEKENQKGKHEITYLGPLEHADIIKWYQKASIFVLPSFDEGFPVTILEAFSCETPVVATPVGGIPELVQDGKNGVLVPINDSLGLAQGIRFLLENKGIRTKFGREGRTLVTRDFSIETVARKLCKIYLRLIN